MMKRTSSALTTFTPPQSSSSSEDTANITFPNNTSHSVTTQDTTDTSAKRLCTETSHETSPAPLSSRDISITTTTTTNPPLDLTTLIEKYKESYYEITKFLTGAQDELVALRATSKFFQRKIDISNRLLLRLTVDELLTLAPNTITPLNPQINILDSPQSKELTIDEQLLPLYPLVVLTMSDIKIYEKPIDEEEYSKDDFQKLEKEFKKLISFFNNPFNLTHFASRITSIELNFFWRLLNPINQVNSLITFLIENTNFFCNLRSFYFLKMINLDYINEAQMIWADSELCQFNLPKLPDTITYLMFEDIEGCRFQINEFPNNLTGLIFECLHDTEIYFNTPLPDSLSVLSVGPGFYKMACVHYNSTNNNNSFYFTTSNYINPIETFFKLPPLTKNLTALFLPTLDGNYYTDSDDIKINFPHTLPKLQDISMKRDSEYSDLFKIGNLPTELPKNLTIEMDPIDPKSKERLEALIAKSKGQE